MKIEMGESLFYSWLRHVKECQIVQTNWTTSARWPLHHRAELEALMTCIDEHFSEKLGYRIFKQTSSLSQLLQQAECDAIGISMQDKESEYYAVDVAFHELGLSYGSKDSTAMKVLAKCVRSAMCVYGYLNSKRAEIIFASPKIHNSVLELLTPCMDDLQAFMNSKGYQFRFRLIANSDFKSKIMDPLLNISKGITDTNELYLRAYQMNQMFEKTTAQQRHSMGKDKQQDFIVMDYTEFKVGQLAQTFMRETLERGLSDEELQRLQDAKYSRENFGLKYALLVKEGARYDRNRYYVQPIKIGRTNYYLCSQWLENQKTNHRPQLIKWIQEHSNAEVLDSNQSDHGTSEDVHVDVESMA